MKTFFLCLLVLLSTQSTWAAKKHGASKTAAKPAASEPKVSDEQRRLPYGNPVEGGKVVEGYGVSEKTHKRHNGLDIQGKPKQAVSATADGTVLQVVEKEKTFTVEVDHGNSITTRYGQLPLASVKVGQKLTRGSKVGILGEKPLFYQVMVNGIPVDPQFYMGK